MRRIFVFVCIIGSIGACVNLGKPEKVAECAASPKGCVNSSLADGGGSSSDTKSDTKKDGIPNTDSPGADTAPDVTQPTDDTLPVNPEIDGGELPDAPISDTPTPILPDGPTATNDGPSDTAVVIPDGPLTPPTDGRDTPILSDGPTDVGPVVDTRDAPRDVAVGICAPGGVIQPAGTPCRPAAGLCDIAETCDGVTADCPADKLAAAGKECRAVAGDCDLAESCTGTSPDCPVDGFKQAGAVCRAAVAGGCDVAESCTGASATCPVDSLAPSTTVCRASTDANKCDPAENCTGSSTTCPSDVIYTLPAVPGTVGAVAGTQQATIAWAAAVGATGYNVKRSITTGTGYTTLGSSPTTSVSPYIDNGLAASTYYYVVSSINTIATCESANSSQVSAIPTNPCTPPTLITNLAATPGNGSITLAWTAPATATVYTVYRKDASGTVDYAPIAANIVPTTTPPSYQDQAVVYGTTYSYVVTASNGTCSSNNSNAVTSSPLCSPPATTPTGLTASIPTIGGRVTLTWTAAASAQTYQILRKLSSDPSYTQIVQVTGATLTYTDSGLTNGTSYDYVLTSNNGTCASATSAVVTAVPQCSVAKPVIQTPVTVGDKEVDLSWNTPTGAVSYVLSRKVSTDTTYAVITTPALTVTSYADKDPALVNTTTYNYVVSASNGNCASVNSDPVSATPVCTPPAAPGTLTGSAGDAKVTLTWLASPSSPDSYTIQRKTGAGAFADLFTTANGTTLSYVDNTAANGTTYSYQVRANKGSCSSTTYTNTVPATPQPTCTQGAPGTPTATMTTGTRVNLAWTAATPVPSGGYNIARSTSSTTGYASIGSVTGATLTFTDPAAGLTIGTTYYYQITAIGTTCSTPSAAGSVALACQTPAVPSPSATNSSGSITITWAAVSGATAYTVYRNSASTGTFTAISSGQTAATYTDPASGLTNGTNYYYKVSASNAGGNCASAQSAATAAVRSCTIPTAPVGLSAKRSGNKQVTLVWTNSPGATTYNILRSTTSGSGYASVGTPAASPFVDTNAVNTTPYFYVVAARSDAGGNCSSANSAEVSAPSCSVWASGTHSQQLTGGTGSTAEWCAVTCADLSSGSAWAQSFACGGRTTYFNGIQATCGTSVLTPAKANGGYAFYFTPAADGGFVGAQIGNVVADGTCP
jgi:fibronectin type 3 domain-containing protein